MLSSSGKRFSLLLECEDRFVIGTLKKKKLNKWKNTLTPGGGKNYKKGKEIIIYYKATASNNIDIVIII